MTLSYQDLWDKVDLAKFLHQKYKDPMLLSSIPFLMNALSRCDEEVDLLPMEQVVVEFLGKMDTARLTLDM